MRRAHCSSDATPAQHCSPHRTAPHRTIPHCNKPPFLLNQLQLEKLVAERAALTTKAAAATIVLRQAECLIELLSLIEPGAQAAMEVDDKAAGSGADGSAPGTTRQSDNSGGGGTAATGGQNLTAAALDDDDHRRGPASASAPPPQQRQPAAPAASAEWQRAKASLVQHLEQDLAQQPAPLAGRALDAVHGPDVPPLHVHWWPKGAAYIQAASRMATVEEMRARTLEAVQLTGVLLP